MSIRLLFMFFVIMFLSTDSVLAIDGIPATASTRGKGSIVVGNHPYDLNNTKPIEGSISISVKEMGNRWSHIQNIDQVKVTSEFIYGNSKYKIMINKAMPRHPYGKYTTFFGVAYNEEINGNTFIGTSMLPKLRPDIAIWGWAEVIRDDEIISTMVPAHVKVMTSSPLKGIMLEVDTETKFIHEIPDGYINVFWSHIDSLNPPTNQEKKRQRFGWIVLVALNIGFLWLAIKE
jgi:hypothetical protein